MVNAFYLGVYEKAHAVEEISYQLGRMYAKDLKLDRGAACTSGPVF